MENEVIINDSKIKKRQIDYTKTKNWIMSDWHCKMPYNIPLSRPHLKRMISNMENELVFTKVYDDFVGRIITNEHIWRGDNPIPVVAAWDTGSTLCCISPEFAKQLNLQPISEDDLHTAHGIMNSKMYEINVLLSNQVTYTVYAMENPNIHGDNVDLLIGMDIIKEGDFTISTYNGKTSFSFRIPSKGLVDYTKE